MKVNIKELIKSIGKSDVLGIGKDDVGNTYITQGHFIVKVDKEVLTNNIRLATTITDDFGVESAEDFIDSIKLNEMVLSDGRTTQLSDMFYQVNDYIVDYSKVEFVEHNISENMVLLENQVDKNQIVVDYGYFNMIKDNTNIVGMGQFSPVVVLEDKEVLGYILPMRVDNKKEIFKKGKDR